MELTTLRDKSSSFADITAPLGSRFPRELLRVAQGGGEQDLIDDRFGLLQLRHLKGRRRCRRRRRRFGRESWASGVGERAREQNTKKPLYSNKRVDFLATQLNASAPPRDAYPAPQSTPPLRLFTPEWNISEELIIRQKTSIKQQRDDLSRV